MPAYVSRSHEKDRIFIHDHADPPSTFIMQPSAILKNAYLRQCRRVWTLLNKQPDDFTPEDFHMLRVAIKRIKVIMDIITASCSEFNGDKFFRPYKILFTQAGEVRELQLRDSMLKAYKPETALREYAIKWQLQHTEAQRKFFDLLTAPFLKKLKQRQKKIIPFFESVSSKDAKRFLNRNRKDVESILQLETPEKEDYHKLRKKIKSLYYLQKLFRPAQKSMRLAEPFQELLGQWHDYWLVSNDLLKDAQNHKLEPTEVRALMSLQKKISNRAAALFEKIHGLKAQFSPSASYRGT